VAALIVGFSGITVLTVLRAADPDDTVFLALGLVEMATAMLLLAIGARHCLARSSEPFSPKRSHTWVIGVFAAMSSLFIVSSVARSYSQPGFTAFAIALFSLLATLSAVVVVLRVRRSPLARSATAAHNVFWAIFFPFGTALWLWWLLSVRRYESRAV
jgi:hypothetical protein